MSVFYVVIATTILSALFYWIENAINPNMSKWARAGFRLAVILIVGLIAFAVLVQ